MISKLKILLLVIVTFSIYSCAKTGLTFSNDIEPLLNGCSSLYCHGGSNSKGNTNSYESFVKFVETGTVIPALRSEEGFTPMPPYGSSKLTEDDINLLEEWIDGGMAK